jgi:glycosyltransferase involved in cell wall biosynthesis
MKVLWFTNTPANADEYFNRQLKGTGGWLKALDQELQKHISLHVAFHFFNDKKFIYKESSYYPIKIKNKLWKNVFRILGLPFFSNTEYLKEYLEIIQKIKPDLIHIHGTENLFGCIIPHTVIPVVVSVQGNITVYHHKFLSGFERMYLFKFKYGFFSLANLKNIKMFKSEYSIFEKLALIEKMNLSNVRFIIGRTDWDRRITRALSPHSKYFHNDEILRDSFYKAEWKKIKKNKNFDTFVINTTNGNSFYKGFETLCYALKILNELGFNCEWRVAGINQSDLIYYITKEKLKDNFPHQGLVLMGNLSEQELVESLLKADVYVMPSHIENSPNNLSEAMILGIPCISTFVGGSGSLIADKINGLLIQSGDPWAMAGAIIEIATNDFEAIRLGLRGREDALKRHCKERIITDLLSIYKAIKMENT